jgi:hypothetical protein
MNSLVVATESWIVKSGASGYLARMRSHARQMAKLAQNGAKVAGTVIVGAATGRFSGVVIGATAMEMVREMTTE